MFEHIFILFDPIDFWERAELADQIIQEAVLEQMPESPRDGKVYKILFPNPPYLTEIYLCKADNNGTIYIFSNFNIKNVISDVIEF